MVSQRISNKAKQHRLERVDNSRYFGSLLTPFIWNQRWKIWETFATIVEE